MIEDRSWFFKITGNRASEVEKSNFLSFLESVCSTNRNGYLQRKEEKEKNTLGARRKVCMARSTCLHKTHALVAPAFQ